jgi:hypothetical protein
MDAEVGSGCGDLVGTVRPLHRVSQNTSAQVDANESSGAGCRRARWLRATCRAATRGVSRRLLTTRWTIPSVVEVPATPSGHGRSNEQRRSVVRV